VVYDASVSTWKRYSKYFDDIAIINFHDREKPIQVEFFCDINPELHNTCQQVKKKKLTRSNPSQNLQLKYLINAAVEKNILDLGKSNNEKILKAEGEINRFMREDLNIEWKDLPSECHEDLWEVLFQQTLKNEIEIVPAWFEERGGEEALRKDFEIFKENKSCNINIDEILEDEKWVEFFGNLVI
jgi:hypothetical protein